MIDAEHLTKKFGKLSARANSIGGLMFVPFMIIYLAGEIGAISLDTNNLLIISGAILVIDVALFYFNIATFRRDEILTNWK